MGVFRSNSGVFYACQVFGQPLGATATAPVYTLYPLTYSGTIYGKSAANPNNRVPGYRVHVVR
ncbi:MAG: hypothetical protein L0215_19115 [Gemmataceae bacterium]|nr:hypothetical protein [Gemmataceae bacterium]